MLKFLHIKLWMIVTLTTIITLMLGTPEVYAQKRTVTGTVKADDGSTLPGVSILEKGTNNGTVTDTDGNFSLNVSEGSTLVISFIGMVPQEVAVGSQTRVDVVLATDVQTLEEVVVVVWYDEEI